MTSSKQFFPDLAKEKLTGQANIILLLLAVLTKALFCNHSQSGVQTPKLEIVESARGDANAKTPFSSRFMTI